MIDLKKYHAEQDKLSAFLMTWDRSDLMECLSYLTKRDIIEIIMDGDLLGDERETILKEIEDLEK